MAKQGTYMQSAEVQSSIQRKQMLTKCLQMRDIFASLYEQGSGSHRGPGCILPHRKDRKYFSQFNVLILGPSWNWPRENGPNLGNSLSGCRPPGRDAEEGKKRGLDGEREKERGQTCKTRSSRSSIQGKGGNHERTRIFCKRPISQKTSLTSVDFPWYFFQSGECPHLVSQNILPSLNFWDFGKQFQWRSAEHWIGPLGGRSMGILAELSLRS